MRRRSLLLIAVLAAIGQSSVSFAAQADLVGQWHGTFKQIEETWTVAQAADKWTVAAVYVKAGAQVGASHGEEVEAGDHELKFVRIVDKKADESFLDHQQCKLVLTAGGKLQLQIKTANGYYIKTLTRVAGTATAPAKIASDPPIAPDTTAPATTAPATAAPATTAPGATAEAEPPPSSPPAHARKEKPKPNDALLTFENYNKIQPGLTRAEVEAILGGYRWFEQKSSSKHEYGWHVDGDNKHVIKVDFEKGVVVSKSTTMDFSAGIAAVSSSTLATHFVQLTLGMTEDQVVAIMGKPSDTQQGSGNRSGMLWKPAAAPEPAKSPKKKPGKEAKPSKTPQATEPEAFAVAYFVCGKLTDMDCSEVPPRTHELTIANAHRIRVGLTAAEVEQILGPPAETKPLNDNVRNLWQHGKDRLIVVLKDGVVWHINSTLASLPLLSFEKTNEDRINQALANLTSGDEKRKLAGAEYFAGEAVYDESKAPEVSKALLPLLHSKQLQLTSPAESALRRWATADSADTFIAILSGHAEKSNGFGRDISKTKVAIDILVRLRSPQAAAPIVRLMKEFFSRDDAADAVRALGPELTRAELRKYTNDRNAEFSHAVQEILAEFDNGGPFFQKYLNELASPDKGTRVDGAKGLGRMYPLAQHRQQVAGLLAKALADTDSTVALVAAQGLARWGTSAQEPELIVAVSHSSADVRRYAAHALAALGTPQSLAALEDISGDSDPRVALAAKDAAAAIERRNAKP